MQYQGDSASSGYAAVLTDPFRMRTRWTVPADIGTTSSAVVDPTLKAIYLCDTTGHLWRFDDGGGHGTAHWSRTVAENAYGFTPAVDRAGRIYAIFKWGQFPDWHGVLVCFTPDGVEQWRYEPPPFTSANLPSFLGGGPKIWQQPDGTLRIFFILFWLDYNNDLYHSLVVVVNEQGIPQSTAELGSALIFDAHGGGGFRLRPPSRNPLAGTSAGDEGPQIAGVAPSGGSDFVGLPPETILPWGGSAVFDDGPLDQPVVVATDGAGNIGAWRWKDLAGFLPLWLKHYDDGGTSPPAVLPNGLLAVGGADSVVRLLDPMSGDEFHPWPKLDGRVWAPPASFMRQLYVGSMGGDFAMIDSNGTVVRKANLGGACATPAIVTGSSVFVYSANGLYGFDLFLNKIAEIHFLGDMGQSSPAIGQDGTIYLVVEGRLQALAADPSVMRITDSLNPARNFRTE